MANVQKLHEFLNACRQGKIDEVVQFIASGESLNELDHNNVNCLYIAIDYGREQIAHLLLDHEVNTNVTHKTTFLTPLHLAVYHGFERLVIRLLRRANVNNCSAREKNLPLYSTNYFGMVKVVNRSSGKSENVNALTREKKTPLHLAWENKDYRMMEVLLNAGALPDYPREDGKRLLEVAIGSRQLDYANLLLKYGANPNAYFGKRLSFLYQAVTLRDLDLVNLLLDYKAFINIENGVCNSTALHLASYSLWYVGVQLLINRGANPDVRNSLNHTPLSLAIQQKDEKMIGILVKGGARGANLNRVIEGKTYLHTAVLRKSYELAEVLLKSGIDVDAVMALPKISYDTALSLAVRQRSLELVKLLVKYNASVNATKEENESPLLIASANDDVEICKILLTAGADPNVADKFSFTPLHFAAKHRNVELADTLIRLGASLNSWSIETVRNSCSTPLHCAIESRDILMMHTLLAAGADIYNSVREAPRRGSVEEDSPLTFAMQHLLHPGVKIMEILLDYGKTSSNLDTLLLPHLRTCHDVFKDVLMQYMALFLFRIYGDRPINEIVQIRGYSVTNLNSDFCNYEACVRELIKLRDIVIDENKSLLDLLYETPKQFDIFFSGREELCEEFYNKNFEGDFPFYHKMLKRRIQQAHYKNRVRRCLRKLLDYPFITDIAEHILGFLSLRDFEVMTKICEGFCLSECIMDTPDFETR